MPDSVNPNPPTVEPADERRHEPGPDPLWNESWYLDLADPVRELGLYVRLGLYPNIGRSWFHLVVAGRDRPTVLVSDEHGALPEGGELQVESDAWSVSLEPDPPLQSFRVTTRGRGQRLHDPLAVYRQEPGEACDVEADLTWTTVATPYHYGATTRYEVSCQVTGTIRVDDEIIEVDCPGQRDHSWGVRDWWAFEWVWSAGRLDDGTAFHGSHIRLPGTGVAFGYLVRPDGVLVPARSVDSSEDLGPEGIPARATIVIDPVLELDLELIGLGPLLLLADDGRVSRFPRALCRFTTPDGRTGTGWTEWNQVQPSRTVDPVVG